MLSFLVLLVAAQSPDPEPPVKRVELPAGEVKFESVKVKDAPAVRVTAGKVVVTQKEVFIGDGKVAMKVTASPDGMQFTGAAGLSGPSSFSGKMSNRGGTLTIDGTCVCKEGMVWRLRTEPIAAEKIPAKSVYLITKSLKVEKAGATAPGIKDTVKDKR
jgi:hypothetical protein